MWVNIVIAIVVAILFTMPIVWLLGWRRPGAPTGENIWLSGLFLFALVFLMTWAISAWIEPWGPAVWGVSWLMVLIIAAFVALLVLVASPVSRDGGLAPGGTAVTATGVTDEAAEGIGILFWVLILLLVLAAVVGSTGV